jgi:hypothetical protein
VNYDLDTNIRDEESYQQELLALLTRSRERVRKYREVRSLLTGEEDPLLAKDRKRKFSIPQAAALILKDGEQHLDEVVKRLPEYGIYAVKTTVTTSLLRLAKRGKVFVKTGPNRYDLIENVEKKGIKS